MTLSEHFRKNFVLAVPVIIGQLGHIMVVVADTMMVGRVGVIPLAAATFASTFLNVLMVFGIGVSYAMTPLVAATPREDKKTLLTYLEGGFILNFLLSIGLTLIGVVAAHFLGYFGQDQQVAAEAYPYLIIVSTSLIPLMIFQTFRQYSEGLSDTFWPMVVSIVANLINIFFNYLLIYGNWGFPALGLAGAGYATLISRMLMPFFMIWLLRHKIPRVRWVFNFDVIKRMLKIGLPSGFQYLFEVVAFAGSAVMIGWISPQAQAAHQIAINMASVSFMCALGLSSAATIRVGNQMGLRNKQDLRLAGYTSLLSVLIVMSTSALIFIVLRDQLVSLYIDDAEVRTIATRLLIIAAAFQLSDGLQAVGLGILRGLQDVKIPTLITFVAYWVVAIPLGYLLGFTFHLGVDGVWYALSFGLTIAAAFHFIRFTRLVSQTPF